jgi:hypothetical protein
MFVAIVLRDRVHLLLCLKSLQIYSYETTSKCQLRTMFHPSEGQLVNRQIALPAICEQDFHIYHKNS